MAGGVLFGIASGYEAVGLLCTFVGLLALGMGTFMFVRFIRKYPPENIEIEEAASAS